MMSRSPTSKKRVRDLYDRVKESAAKAGRSISAEIEYRVKESLDREEHTLKQGALAWRNAGLTYREVSEKFGINVRQAQRLVKNAKRDLKSSWVGKSEARTAAKKLRSSDWPT